MSEGDMEVVGVPADVSRHLASLRRPGGELVDLDLVADARDESSPLHCYFEWDDTAAAEAHRVAQAQALIRRVRVTIIRQDNPEPIRVRAYVAVKEIASAARADVPAGAYVPIESIPGKSSQESDLMSSMKRDIARLRRKYHNHELLLQLWEQAD